MPLSKDDIKKYRSKAQSLKPIVMIAGNGLSEGVMNELDRALTDHELIKVKLVIEDRELRKALSEELCLKNRCELVQSIGKTIIIYREAKKPKVGLSNAR